MCYSCHVVLTNLHALYGGNKKCRQVYALSSECTAPQEHPPQ
jgi:hypothetical protein